MPRRSLKRFDLPIVASFLTVPLLIGSSAAQVPSPKQTSDKSALCLKQDSASGARHSRPVWLTSSELMDRVIERRPIERPGPLGKNSLRGVVNIAVLVNKQGKIICARGVEGHPLGIAAAIRSLRQWTFRPYTVGRKLRTVAGVLAIPYDLGS